MRDFFPWCFLMTLVLCHCAPMSPVTVPKSEAVAANQLCLAGNACGPTAALNALRHGSAVYQAVAAGIPGDNDTKQLRDLVLHQGSRTSRHTPHRRRWSLRGINAVDLTDLINELLLSSPAPEVRLWIPQGSDKATRMYRRIARSLKVGFPPIVGLRRYAGFEVIDSHYVTVVGVAPCANGDENAFVLTYLDPMGARTLQGIVRCEKRGKSWRCVADFPQTPVGLRRAKGPSQLHVDSLIVAP